MSRDDFIRFRRSLGRTPPLDRMTVPVRGLAFAVWTSPPVAQAPPLLLVNGGMLYDDHTLLWPALSPLAPHAANVTGAANAARLRRGGYDWRDELRALFVPTLVLHGERDALPSAVALELSELLPNARHALLPDAGHMPFWEAPERFFSVVDAFLAAPSTGPPRRSQ